MIPSQQADFTSIEDLLLIQEDSTKTGPQLPMPITALNNSSSFTVELWFALEQTSYTNISLIGMTGKPWYTGFGIAGSLNSTFISLACLIDTSTIACSTSSCPCAGDTRLCKSMPTALHVWNHFSCSRADNNKTQIMLNNDATVYYQSANFTTSVYNLFYPGNLVLGPRIVGATKTESFIGYIREIKIWSKWLDQYTIMSMMNK